MTLQEMQLVQVQYLRTPGPASGPHLQHKRIFAFKDWPGAARKQMRVLYKAIAEHEGTAMDKVRIADINTIGSVYVEE